MMCWDGIGWDWVETVEQCRHYVHVIRLKFYNLGENGTRGGEENIWGINSVNRIRFSSNFYLVLTSIGRLEKRKQHQLYDNKKKEKEEKNLTGDSV